MSYLGGTYTVLLLYTKILHSVQFIVIEQNEIKNELLPTKDRKELLDQGYRVAGI